MEWDYSGRKGRDGQKKKIGKANGRKGKVKRGKDEEVNGEGGRGLPQPHTGQQDVDTVSVADRRQQVIMISLLCTYMKLQSCLHQWNTLWQIHSTAYWSCQPGWRHLVLTPCNRTHTDMATTTTSVLLQYSLSRTIASWWQATTRQWQCQLYNSFMMTSN